MRIAPATINSCGLVRGGSLLALSAVESEQGRETTRTMETVKFELARSRVKSRELFNDGKRGSVL